MGMRETGGKVSGAKATGAQVSQETGGKGDMLMGESETDNSLPSDKAAGQNVMEGIHRKSYSEAVIEGARKRARVFVGDSIVRKTDIVLNKGDDVVVCLSGAKIKAITERVENIVGSGKGGSVLVQIGTNNVEREGTTAIVRKYRKLVRTLKQTRIEQVILSGIRRQDGKERNILEYSNIQLQSYSSACYSNLALLSIFSYLYIYLCGSFSCTFLFVLFDFTLMSKCI